MEGFPPERLTLGSIIHKMLQKCYSDYAQFIETLGNHQDAQKKDKINKFLEMYKIVFVRALNLVRWSKNASELQNCLKILKASGERDFIAGNAANDIGAFSFGLWTIRAPPYVVPAAVDVLAQGSYSTLPTSMKVEDIVALVGDDRLKNIVKLNDVIRMALLHVVIPKNIHVQIMGGRAYLRKENMYEISLTLFGPEQNYGWRIVSLESLIKPNLAVNTMVVEETTILDKCGFYPHQTGETILILQEFLNRIPDNPFVEICEILDEFSLTLHLAYLHQSAIFLNNQKWKALEIKYEKSSHLDIYYWRGMKLFDPKPFGEIQKTCLKIKINSAELLKEDENKVFVDDDVYERKDILLIKHSPSLNKPINIEAGRIEGTQVICMNKLMNKVIVEHSTVLVERIYEYLTNKQNSESDTLFAESDLIRILKEDNLPYVKIKFAGSLSVKVAINAHNGAICIKTLSTSAADVKITNVLVFLNRGLEKQINSLDECLLVLKSYSIMTCVVDACRDLNLEKFEELPLYKSKNDNEQQKKNSLENCVFKILYVRLAIDRYLKITLDTGTFVLEYEVINTEIAEGTLFLLKITSSFEVFPAMNSEESFLICNKKFLTDSDKKNRLELENELTTIKKFNPVNCINIINRNRQEKSLYSKAIVDVIKMAQIELKIKDVTKILEKIGIPFYTLAHTGHHTNESTTALLQILTIPVKFNIACAIGRNAASTVKSSISSILMRFLESPSLGYAWQAEINWKIKFPKPQLPMHKVIGTAMCDVEENSLYLRYKSINESEFLSFLKHWRKVVMVSHITRLIKKVINTQWYPDWEIQIGSFNFLSLNLRYRIKSKEPSNVWHNLGIHWNSDKGTYSVAMSGDSYNPHGPITYYLANLLNKVEKVDVFITALYETLMALQIIGKGINSVSLQNAGYNSLKTEPKTLLNFKNSLQTDPVVAIPQSLASVLIVFAQKFSIKINFENRAAITITDMASSFSRTNEPYNVVSISGFFTFCKLLDRDNFKIDITDSVQEIVRMDVSVFSVFFQKLINLMGSVSSLDSFFKAQERISNSNNPNPGHQIRGFGSVELTETINAGSNVFQFSIGEAGLASLYCQLLNEKENAIVSRFFNKRCYWLSNADSQACFESFYTILSLPIDLLKDFVKLMSFEENNPVSFLLKSPKSISASHLPETGKGCFQFSNNKARFMVRLYFDSCVFVDAALSFNKENNDIYGWEHDPGQKEESIKKESVLKSMFPADLKSTCKTSEHLVQITQRFDKIHEEVIPWTIQQLYLELKNELIIGL